jgi:hypothetical protein
VLEDRVDLLDDALTVNLHGPVLGVAKGDMVDGALLSEVDLLTLEHVVTELLDLGLASELAQQLKGLIGDEVLGEVEDGLGLVNFVGEGARELLETLRVLGKGILKHNGAAELLVVLHKRLPCRQIACLGETRHLDVCWERVWGDACTTRGSSEVSERARGDKLAKKTRIRTRIEGWMGGGEIYESGKEAVIVKSQFEDVMGNEQQRPKSSG